MIRKIFNYQSISEPSAVFVDHGLYSIGSNYCKRNTYISNSYQPSEHPSPVHLKKILPHSRSNGWTGLKMLGHLFHSDGGRMPNNAKTFDEIVVMSMFL